MDERGLTAREAAEILGVTSETYVHALVSRGALPKATRHQRAGLDRGDVERVALERYRPGHPYCASTSGAAAILGVTQNHVRQLVERGFLPDLEHNGRHYFRRHQVEVIVNARTARKIAGSPG